ncbi:hypothetical protein Tsubulata_039632 [Turnera subulata]|uniref:Uncharacterized protein n=1 Tax=Turnera subulata TaxID=218843 RepID=A0A9Q0G6Q6_9ROSI|nr:hypothetical protein Tsubulata_039632 [Turnera subulata]
MGAWRIIRVEFVNLDPKWQKVGGEEEEETEVVARTDQEEEGSGEKRDEQRSTCSAIVSHELLLTETPLTASRVWGPNPKVKLVLTYKMQGVTQENVEDWKQTCIKNWSPHIKQYGEPAVTVKYRRPFDMSLSNPSPDDFKIQIDRGKMPLHLRDIPQEAVDWKGYPEDFPTLFMATTAKLLPNPYVDWAKDFLEPTDYRGWCLTGWPLSDVLRRDYTSIANYPETETESETNTHASFAWRRLKQDGDSSILTRLKQGGSSSILPFRRGYSEQGLQTLLMQDDDIRKIFPFPLHDQKIVEVENCAKIALHRYNWRTKQDFEFLRVINANFSREPHALCFYITFMALDTHYNIDHECQTRVWCPNHAFFENKSAPEFEYTVDKFIRLLHHKDVANMMGDPASDLIKRKEVETFTQRSEQDAGRCVVDLENEEEFSCVFSYAEAAVNEFNENQVGPCLSLKKIEKAYLTLALGKAYDIVFSAHDRSINNQCSCLATVIDYGNQFQVEFFSRIIEGSPFFLPCFQEIVSGQ